MAREHVDEAGPVSPEDPGKRHRWTLPIVVRVLDWLAGPAGAWHDVKRPRWIAANPEDRYR
jgi:hypothetical protein